MKKHSWRIKVEFTEQRLVPGTNGGELPWHLNPTKPTNEMPLLTVISSHLFSASLQNLATL